MCLCVYLRPRHGCPVSLNTTERKKPCLILFFSVCFKFTMEAATDMHFNLHLLAQVAELRGPETVAEHGIPPCKPSSLQLLAQVADMRPREPVAEHADGAARMRFPQNRATGPKSEQEKERARQIVGELERKQARDQPQCEQCSPPRRFTAKSSLISHIQSQHVGMKYQCEVKGCNSGFTRRTSLKYHMMVHNGKFRFECEKCSKKFRHKGHYKEHLQKCNPSGLH